jgi:hypothetical protein
MVREKFNFGLLQADPNDSKDSVDGGKRSRFRESVLAVLKRLQGQSFVDILLHLITHP